MCTFPILLHICSLTSCLWFTTTDCVSRQTCAEIDETAVAADKLRGAADEVLRNIAGCFELKFHGQVPNTFFDLALDCSSVSTHLALARARTVLLGFEGIMLLQTAEELRAIPAHAVPLHLDLSRVFLSASDFVTSDIRNDIVLVNFGKTRADLNQLEKLKRMLPQFLVLYADADENLTAVGAAQDIRRWASLFLLYTFPNRMQSDFEFSVVRSSTSNASIIAGLIREKIANAHFVSQSERGLSDVPFEKVMLFGSEYEISPVFVWTSDYGNWIVLRGSRSDIERVRRLIKDLE